MAREPWEPYTPPSGYYTQHGSAVLEADGVEPYRRLVRSSGHSMDEAFVTRLLAPAEGGAGGLSGSLWAALVLQGERKRPLVEQLMMALHWPLTTKVETSMRIREIEKEQLRFKEILQDEKKQFQAY